jgi:hypothetical protein
MPPFLLSLFLIEEHLILLYPSIYLQQYEE